MIHLFDDSTGQTDESFTYDANGNRTFLEEASSLLSSTVGLHNRILNDGKFTYTYDAEGNRTSKTDNVSGSKVEYAWNHANLLTNVVYKTSNNVVTKSVAYQYDALGRRIGKSVDENGNGTVDRRESYIYDGAGLLSSFSTGIGGEGARRAVEGTAIHISGPNGVMGQHGWVDQMVLSFIDTDGDGSGAMTLASRNLYGDAVDQIFATESGSGDVFWALTDHQGTPRDWATRSASGTTTIAQHTRYTAFGAIESVTGSLPSTLAALPSFTGQLLDPDTDLLYYRARWYDPQHGKFLSDDPMGFEAGDVNVSRYVLGKSTKLRDPSGLADEYVDGNLRFIGNATAIEQLKEIYEQMKKTYAENEAVTRRLREITQSETRTEITVTQNSIKVLWGDYRTSTIDIEDINKLPTNEGPSVSRYEVLMHEIAEQHFAQEKKFKIDTGEGYDDAHNAGHEAEALIDDWIRQNSTKEQLTEVLTPQERTKVRPYLDSPYEVQIFIFKRGEETQHQIWITQDLNPLKPLKASK